LLGGWLRFISPEASLAPDATRYNVGFGLEASQKRRKGVTAGVRTEKADAHRAPAFSVLGSGELDLC
jgi:hypothetical protein